MLFLHLFTDIQNLVPGRRIAVSQAEFLPHAVVDNENAGIEGIGNAINHIIYFPGIHRFGPGPFQADNPGFHIFIQRLEQPLVDILEIMLIGTGNNIRCRACRNLGRDVIPEIGIAGIFQEFNRNSQIPFNPFKCLFQTFGFIIRPDTNGQGNSLSRIIVGLHHSRLCGLGRTFRFIYRRRSFGCVLCRLSCGPAACRSQQQSRTQQASRCFCHNFSFHALLPSVRFCAHSIPCFLPH